MNDERPPTTPARSDPAPTLSYAPPAPRDVSPVVICCTALVTGLLMFVAVFALLFAGITSNILIAWLFIPLVFGAAIALAVRAQRRSRGRSVALGLWIGIGLTLLVEGICFVRIN